MINYIEYNYNLCQLNPAKNRNSAKQSKSSQLNSNGILSSSQHQRSLYSANHHNQAWRLPLCSNHHNHHNQDRRLPLCSNHHNHHNHHNQDRRLPLCSNHHNHHNQDRRLPLCSNEGLERLDASLSGSQVQHHHHHHFIFPPLVKTKSHRGVYCCVNCYHLIP